MSNPRAELPEDAKRVSVSEAHEHGYHGVLPDEEDNHVYTVAGVTEGLSDKAPDRPAPANRSAAKKEADK
ncbi:MAG TPA: hypothetical protein VIQ30_24220 [Pseudonocardia sp.]